MVKGKEKPEEVDDSETGAVKGDEAKDVVIEDGNNENDSGGKGKKEKEKEVQIFSDVLMKAFLPFRLLLIFLGRNLLSQKKIGPGDYSFKGNLCSCPGIHFIFTTVILFYTLIVGTFNLFVIVMDIDFHPSQNNPSRKRELLLEKVVLERHFVMFIVAWTSLVHGCICSIQILVKREYMANYFSFWTRAVDKMYMDVARGVLSYSIGVCLGFLLMIALLVFLAVFRLGPSTIGGPITVFMLMFRHMIIFPWIDSNYEVPLIGIYITTLFQIIGGIFFLFIYISSKIYIFVFLFKCKLLRNAFANWNGRVYAAVLRGGDFIQSDKGRTTYSLLFKDHCILLDLMEGTDRLFSIIIESYFGLQVVSICFEGYFFIRTAKWSEKQVEAFEDGRFFIRPYDYAPGLIILVVSLVILIVVSKAAAEVGEEGLAGLEVIRRKTMLGRRTDEELYFTLSMFSSYTAYKKLQLSGGGYFYLDKEFIIAIVSTIFSYFIITYQFQPKLDYTPSPTDLTRCEIGLFLQKFEYLPPRHWTKAGEREVCMDIKGKIVT